MRTIPQRPGYQGVLQIVRYNYQYYLISVLWIASGGVLTVFFTPGLLRCTLIVGLCLATWWMLTSLVASHWIYDRSGLFNLTWLTSILKPEPRRWVLIHSGLDETSNTLRRIFSHSSGAVLNIYDPSLMTEPSIRRAVSQKTTGREARCSHTQFPLENRSSDVTFLIFSAHELRADAGRTYLFRELRRTLKVGGRLVMVEHLRDVRNFCVFGPGFLHFLSRNVWQNLASEQGLRLEKTFSITPFVHVFLWQKVEEKEVP